MGGRPGSAGTTDWVTDVAGGWLLLAGATHPDRTTDARRVIVGFQRSQGDRFAWFAPRPRKS